MRAKVALVIATIFFFAGLSEAQVTERVGVGYSITDDGGCPEVGNTLTAEYERRAGFLDVSGWVRTAPSGGNCRQDAFSYDVELVRYFDLRTFDLMVEFGANEQAAHAPYALTLGGMVIPRPSDGGPLNVQNLPAGATTTITGVVGLSRMVGPLRVSAGVNFVPVDWMVNGMVQQGRSVQLGTGYGRGGFRLDWSVNAGEHANFGEVSSSYRWDLSSGFDMGLSLEHRWGINAVDNGAPDEQVIEEAVYRRIGAPRNHATFASLTFGYSPR